MTPADLYRAGRLKDAIDAQIQEVRANPADHGRRTFLFELLAFAGEWDRARKQLDAVKAASPELEVAVEGYRKLLSAEDERRRTFREAVMPRFLVQPPRWLDLRLQAVAALKDGREAEAADLVARADEAAPPVAGRLNGEPVEGLRDADDRFGPVLEVLAKGGYYWLPLEQCQGLTANPPKFPRDLLWFPVKLSVKDGPAGDAFLPTLYPGTETAADDAVKLGRSTVWSEAEPLRGTGLRLLLAGDQNLSTLDLREYQAT